MANLFIGFPVPRAKIADMIEGAAPPLDHATQHEYGGDDAIDPTDQNSLVTLPFPLAGFFLDSYEVEGPGWQYSDTGDGAMFLYADRREMQTGSTNPSTYSRSAGLTGRGNVSVSSLSRESRSTNTLREVRLLFLEELSVFCMVRLRFLSCFCWPGACSGIHG